MAAAAAASLAAAAASAQPIESCSPVDFGPDFGATFGSVVLTDQLAHCGLHFSTTHPAGVIWYWAGIHGSAFDYCINAGGVQSPPSGLAPVRIDFDRPAESVSIRGYDGGPDRDRLVLQAYGPGDLLVDAVALFDGSNFQFPGSVATVTADRIDYVTVHVDGVTAGLFLDDLSWVPATGDSDGDGIADGEDSCVDSITTETLAVGACDTRVTNDLVGEGCTMADRVDACVEGAPNDRRLRRCVRLLAREWYQDGLIRQREKKRILACANELGS